MAIRFAREEDLAQILAIYAPFVERTTVSFEYEVPAREVFLARFRAITAQFPWLVWEEEGRVLGYAYGSAPFERAAYSWCAESSIYLAPEARGRGIGRALYEALEALLRKQGYCLLYALITEENPDSLAFHRALGFRLRADFPRCGYKNGHWLGVIWMEKALGFVENPGNFPKPWREVVENDKN